MIEDGFMISKSADHVGREVTIKGWISHVRSSGALYFIEVRDGTGHMQTVVVKDEVSDKTFDICSGLKIEASIAVKGTIRADSRAPGGFEMSVKDIEPLHIPEEEYPISTKSHGVDFLMEHRHLWLRSGRQLAILRVRSELIKALRDYFHSNGYVLIDTPILTGAVGESTGSLFETEYFDFGKATLAQTGQLYLEAAASALNKVFCFGPTFRAEKSKTRRHLAEFWMLEAEVAFYDSDQNMDLQEDMISYAVQNIANTCGRELEKLDRDVEPLKKIKPPFPRISYSEAVGMLVKKGFPVEWGDDIGGDEETVLSESFEKPVFIFNYPRGVKAFYMKPNPDDDRTVLCNDLLAPEGYGEIIGGSQRNDDHDSLLTRIKDEKLDVELLMKKIRSM